MKITLYCCIRRLSVCCRTEAAAWADAPLTIVNCCRKTRCRQLQAGGGVCRDRDRSHPGLTELSYEDVTPIARLSFDPAAIPVRGDAPWETLEDFPAASRAKPGDVKMGNSGPGSIWHLAHAALEDKVGVK